MIIGSHVVDVRKNDSGPQKQAVILIHGIGVSGKYFLPLANELAQSHHVIAIDLPGYGDTPNPVQTLSIRQLADIVNDLTHELQLQRPVIIGHSMGCQIAAHAVKNAPAMYTKMVLLAPTIYAKERNVVMQTWRLLQDTLHEPVGLSMWAMRDYLRMGPLRYWVTVRGMLQDKIEQTLDGCSLPTLIIRGNRDKIVPKEWVMELGVRMADSVVVEIPGAPHAVHYNAPHAVAAACSTYISK